MRQKNKSQLKVRSSNLSKRETRGRKNDNIIFIICLVIAFAFWGLIKLTHVYDVTYTFNVNYKNVPTDKRLTSMIDSTLDVNFNARGFMILRLNLFEDLSRLDIDLDDISMLKEGREFYVFTQELRDQVAEIISVAESEINFSKTMLGFKLEDLQKKEVAVKASLSLKFKEQYDLYEKEVVYPATVTLFGPQATIDTITQVATENVMLQNVDKDLTLDVGLLNPLPSLLRFEPENVQLRLRVEKFTESSIEIAIDFSEVSEKIQSFPSSAKVYFKIAQKDFNNVQATDFNIKPELTGIDLKEVDRLNLKLTKKPSFTRNEWLVPTTVEFLITK